MYAYMSFAFRRNNAFPNALFPIPPSSSLLIAILYVYLLRCFASHFESDIPIEGKIIVQWGMEDRELSLGGSHD